MHIAIVSDAWYPQAYGVVRTLASLIKELREMGHEVSTITPDLFKRINLPENIQFSLFADVSAHLAKLKPDLIHIAVEGPLGWGARNFCLKRQLPFTTAYHTKFPELIEKRYGIPLAITYPLLREFHAPASGVMVSTAAMESLLLSHSFKNLLRWPLGVDTNMFRPGDKGLLGVERPIWLNVGRLSREKNIFDFLNLDLPGTKVVVGGEAAQLDEFRKCYPKVHFVGFKSGEQLANYYRSADVFVFPSRSDTFGLVLLEALASGVPVAAYPVTGPIDVISSSEVGCLDNDLKKAALTALQLSPERCRDYALRFSWRVCAEKFLSNSEPFRIFDWGKTA